MKTKKYCLSENQMPTQWYNLRADMKEQPDPMLNPATLEPVKTPELYPIFCEELAAQEMDRRYGKGTVTLNVRDSYFNMREKIEPCMFLVEQAKSAMLELGIMPKVQPIRGGTDGARLSFEGLPCPNLCAGGENFHGRFEYVPVEDMEKITELLATIIWNIAK